MADVTYELRTVEDDWDGEIVNTIVRLVDGQVDVEIGGDGYEPEDNTLDRGFSWVVVALQDAYDLGRSHA